MALTTDRLNLSAAAALNASPAITHVQLHTADPGGSGTTAVAAGISRAALSVATASGGAVMATATFTIPAAGGPYTHVSFWTASSGGTYCGSDNASPDATFSNAGSLSYTYTYTA